MAEEKQLEEKKRAVSPAAAVVIAPIEQMELEERTVVITPRVSELEEEDRRKIIEETPNPFQQTGNRLSSYERQPKKIDTANPKAANPFLIFGGYVASLLMFVSVGRKFMKSGKKDYQKHGRIMVIISIVLISIVTIMIIVALYRQS